MIRLNMNYISRMGECDPKLPIVTSANEVKNDPGWSHPIHSHNSSVEIILITEGLGILTYKEKEYLTVKGDVLVMNPGVVHGEKSDPYSPRGSVAIRMNNLHIEGMPENHILPTSQVPILKSGEAFDIFLSLMNTIHVNFEKRQTTLSAPGQHLLVCLLKLLQYFPNSYSELTQKDLNDEDIKDLPVNIKQYIDENYMRNIRLEDISRDLHFSQYYISHIFKEYFNLTISQYIANRRIGEAQRLLTDTALPIKEIAHIVGYENLTHFYAMFKKIKGCSPGVFRVPDL